jgi:O-antigen ligase
VTALIVAAPAAWLLLRSVAERLPPARIELPRRAALVSVAVLAIAAGALAFSADAGRGAGPPTDFLHGRAETWGSAVDAFADRPWAGAGADAFLVASARHQHGQTIRFAHQLPLELGVELGIAGLALALALYAAVASAVWRVRATPAGWLLGPGALAFLVAGLVDWPWHLAGAGAVWALNVGAIAGSRQEND